MKRHPTKHELLNYAETRVTGRGPICARMAAHVKACPACELELAGMKAALGFIESAPPLEAPQAFTAELLRAARRERRSLRQARNRRRSFVVLSRGLGYAAALMLVTMVTFGYVLRGEMPEAPIAAPVDAPERMVASVGPSPEAVRRAKAEIRTFAAALGSRVPEQVSVWEREQRRTALALSAEYMDALEALERNPGCSRASTLARTNLQLRAQTLRTLYVGQSL